MNTVLEDYREKINEIIDFLDSLEMGSGIEKFIKLTDTPSSYIGKGGKLVAVKLAGDGLEFPDIRVESGQPAFLAYNSVSDLNVTGDNTEYTIDFDAEIFDQGGNFAGGIFTAPVDGRYLLISEVMLADLDEDTYETARIRIVTSNEGFSHYWSGLEHSNGLRTVQAMTVANMDANDTAYIFVKVAGGTKSVDVLGGAGTTRYSSFSGALLC